MTTHPMDPQAIVEGALAGIDFGGDSGVLGGPLPEARPQNVLRSTGRQQQAFPGYYDGDQRVILRSLPMETLARLQEALVALDFTSKPIYGEVDEDTVKGFKELLTMANQRRERWQTTLSRSIRSAEEAYGQMAGPEQRPAEVYLPPDYDTITEQVKTVFKQELGRDPSDSEMALLGGQLQSLYRQQFDTEVSAGQLSEDNVGAGRVVQGPPRVDPLASLRAKVGEQFQGEIEEMEDVSTWKNQTANTGFVFDSIGKIIA